MMIKKKKKKLDSRLKCISLISMWVAGLQTLCCTVCGNLNRSPQCLFSQPVVHSLSHGCFFFFFFISMKRRAFRCEASPLML